MEKNRMKYGFGYILAGLKEKFNLDEDKARQDGVMENISRGVEFRGTNLWVLIFATFVASLGLNVNSTAVIIGAMLISPLMGPIMGIGLSVGVNDFELLKRSLRNFGFMVAVSIVTSTIYFIISPLSNAQSELLARTTPTVYDVLIAFFGGLAGIVAQTRRDRTSTVIPGVAIATALMPPLCTAGFGIATGQWHFLIGAAYLFFINAVFIALATYIIVRYMHYSKKEFLDKQLERKVKNYMVIVAVITIIPSIILAYDIVQRSVFDTNAEKYIKSVFQFEKTRVIDYKHNYGSRKQHPVIDILLVGDPLSHEVIENARAQLGSYGLNDTELIVRQSDGTDKIDLGNLQMTYGELLEEKNRRIAELEKVVSGFHGNMLPVADISKEAGFVFGSISSLSLSEQVAFDPTGSPVDTTLVLVVKPEGEVEQIDWDRLNDWIRVRTKRNKVDIYITE